jgi:superfamily I DNA and/or RNA helicase
MTIKPQSAQTLIQSLRRSLLDLTNRNPLINFHRSTSKAISFAAPADTIGHTVLERKTIHLSDLGERPLPHRQKTSTRSNEISESTVAKNNSIPTDPTAITKRSSTKLQTLYFAEDLARHGRRLERMQNIAIQETGAHVLYLCIGFIQYPDYPQSTQICRAPLINIPVRINREYDGHDNIHFSISYTGDEIVKNLSLHEKLHQTYDVILPNLDSESISFEKNYLALVAKKLMHMPNFLVQHQVSLAILSFSNMLIFQDLDPKGWQNSNVNRLYNNDFIQQLIGSQPNISQLDSSPNLESNIQESSNTPLIYDADSTQLSAIVNAVSHLIQQRKGSQPNNLHSVLSSKPELNLQESSNIPLIYDADSTQLNAIIEAVSHHKDMVIVGPPGTGKSQTITNLIASFLHQGKSVLFVAEKLAALEVVKNRLSTAGLAPFLLELHSNKVNKKSVLESIEHSIKYRSDFLTNHADIASYEQLRDLLHTYATYLKNDQNLNLEISYSDLIWQTLQLTNTLMQINQPILPIFGNFPIAITHQQLQAQQQQLDHIQQLFTLIDQTKIKSYSYFSAYENIQPHINIITIYLNDSLSHTIAIRDNVLDFVQLCNNEYHQAIFDETGANIDSIIITLGTIIKLLGTQFSQTDFDNFCYSKDQITLAYTLIESLKHAQTEAQQFTATIIAGFQRVIPYDNNEFELLQKSLQYITLHTMTQEDENNFTTSINTVLRLTTELHQIITAINSNWRTWNIPYHINTIEEMVTILDVSQLWNDLRTKQAHALAKLALTPDIHQTIKVLVQQRHALLLTKAELITIFNFDIDLPDINLLIHAINALNTYQSWDKYFYMDWRIAQKFYKKHTRNANNIPIQQQIAYLSKLLFYIKDLQLYLQNDIWQSQLHMQPDLFTNIEDLLPITDWFETAYVQHHAKKINIIPWFSRSKTEIDNMVINIQSYNAHVVNFQNVYTYIPDYTTETPHSINTLEQLNTFNNLGITHLTYIQTFLNKYAIHTITHAQLWETLNSWHALDELNWHVTHNKKYDIAFGMFFQGLKSNSQYISKMIDIAYLIYNNIPVWLQQTLINSNDLVVTINQIQKMLMNISDSLYAWDNNLHKLQTHISVNPMIHKNLSIGAYCDVIIDIFHDTIQPNFYNWLAYAIASNQFTDTTHTQQATQIEVGVSVVYIHTQSLFTISSINYQTLTINLSPIHTTNELELIVSLSEIVPYDTTLYYPYLLWKYLEHGFIVDNALATTYAHAFMKTVLQANPASFFDEISQHDNTVNNYIAIDKLLIHDQGKNLATKLSRVYLATTLVHFHKSKGINGTRVDEKTEMSLLRHLIPQQRPRMPIRKIISRASESIQLLKPCFMMSPQSVAQYLEPEALHFDVVIMDEASQLTPAEAIGAAVRGSQVIIVGDPKQLPPSQFFSNNVLFEESSELEGTITESILDLCVRRFNTVRDLRWHYRSQHHSLISFSNKEFYQNRLNVFPSPYRQSSDLGITTIYIKHALYQNQMNDAEAQQIVQLILKHVQDKPTQSLGIVTLNLKQSELISELVEEKIGQMPEFIAFTNYWDTQNIPFIIKNLENIQGDERDVIIISITFGPNIEGKILQNFGPISRELGWKRLNVLFTRAKRAITLVTSLRPHQINITDTTPKGTRTFHDYLEYAFSQNEQDITLIDVTVPPQPINEYIVPILESHGYHIVQNLGVVGFAIDIAIKHPHIPDTYIAAILTDGYFYQQSASVRDRERLHVEILTNLGWNDRIYRIWSNEWYDNRDNALQLLLDFLAPLYQIAQQEQYQQVPLITTIDTNSRHTSDEDIITRIKKYLY